MTAPLWFLPSFYGDVRLEKKDNSTEVIVEKATVSEQQALALLSEMAVKKGWLPKKEPTLGEGRNTIKAPIEKVAKALAKLMKPGRKLVTAVRFADGSMEEIAEAPLPAEPKAEKSLAPYREEPKPTVIKEEKKPEKAVTVATPTRGCPAPDFARADIKAREVLEHFLTPEQMEDFRRYNRFMTTGATTGHRYVVTSRHARDQLAHYQRTLYDLDEQRDYCVHDWTVPAAEEMLALHLLLQLPGREGYLRYLEN